MQRRLRYLGMILLHIVLLAMAVRDITVSAFDSDAYVKKYADKEGSSINTLEVLEILFGE